MAHHSFSAVPGLLLLLIAGAASGRDIIVNNVAGDDRRDGSVATESSQLGGPCRTIARALALARPGDRVIVTNTGEPYRESITIEAGRHTGTADHPFTLTGNGAILDGSVPVPNHEWRHVRGELYRFQPPRTSFQMLFLSGKPAARQLAVAGGGLPELAPLEWCLYERQIYFRTEPGRLPSDYAPSYAALAVGITLYEVRHVAVTDFVVQGFQLDGVSAHDSVFDGTLVGLTCRGNGRSGISVGGASRVKILACLVGDNGTAQVRTEGFSRTQVINCDLIESPTAPALRREGGVVSTARQPAATRLE